MAGKNEAERIDDDPFASDDASVMGNEDWREPVLEAAPKSSSDTMPSYQDRDVLPPLQKRRRRKPFRHRRDDAALDEDIEGWSLDAKEAEPEPPMSIALGETRIGGLLRELRANLGEPGKPKRRKNNGK